MLARRLVARLPWAPRTFASGAREWRGAAHPWAPRSFAPEGATFGDAPPPLAPKGAADRAETDTEVFCRGGARAAASTHIFQSDGAGRGKAKWLEAAYTKCTRDGWKPRRPDGSGVETNGSKPEKGNGSKPTRCSFTVQLLDVERRLLPRVRRVHLPRVVQGQVRRVRQATPHPRHTLPYTGIAQYAPPPVVLVLLH